MTRSQPTRARTADAGSRPAGRRDAIVVAAYDCLAAKGFEGLRMRDIAAAAGINIATVHYYFPGKEDVVAGVVGYAHEQFRSAAWPAGAPGEPPRPRQHIAAVFDLLAERPGLGQVLSEIALRAGRDPAVAAITRQAELDWRQALLAILGPREDAEALAAALSLAIKGACLPPSGAADLRLARDELLRRLDPE